MNLQQLQTILNENNADAIEPFYIFINSENSFLSYQYVNRVAEVKNYKLDFIDDIKSLQGTDNSFFGFSEIVTDYLYVNHVDKFEYSDINITNIKNLIIIADSVDKDCIEQFKNYCSVIEMPKLLDWQIKDYAYSKLIGMDNKKIDWLINKCSKDIFRLDNEISRLSIFDRKEKDNLFERFINDGVYNDLSNFAIFDMTNAILTKNLNKVEEILNEISNFDCEPLAVNTILVNSFRNIIKIQLSRNPTAESCGLKPNQFYALKKNCCGFYSKNELLSIFTFLTDVELKLKSGELPVDNLLEYMILGILCILKI